MLQCNNAKTLESCFSTEPELLLSYDLHSFPRQTYIATRSSGLSINSSPIRIVGHLLLNLLLNAVQAIDGAGAIRVEISSLRGDAGIAVTDTGRGIAPEHLPNIFRPFYATMRTGAGLGLSMARRIAEEHRGRIEVTSDVRKGTDSW